MLFGLIVSSAFAAPSPQTLADVVVETQKLFMGMIIINASMFFTMFMTIYFLSKDRKNVAASWASGGIIACILAVFWAAVTYSNPP